MQTLLPKQNEPRHKPNEPEPPPDEKPFLRGDWDTLLMAHFAVTPEAIQGEVPLPLDTRDGEAFVTLVAFRQTHLRFAREGWWARPLAKPVDDHAFLNLRTYVRGPEGPGIWFMQEFINHPLARLVGPPLYGLPYRLAHMPLRYRPTTRRFTATVRGWDNYARLEAEYALAPLPAAEPGTLEHFLHERYVAYTQRGKTMLRFRVWHAPWRMHVAKVMVKALGPAFAWMDEARFLGAFFTPGLKAVGLGAPRR